MTTVVLYVFCVFLFLPIVFGSIKKGFLLHGLPPLDLPVNNVAKPKWDTVVLKQDNFNSNNPIDFPCRFIYNDEFYESNGPIFIMLGGESSVDPFWLQTGQMYDMAREHKAFMFYIEHRYYGQSYPTSDLTTYSLQYLTTEQALADYAAFINKMKQKFSFLESNKVVVFGGSYGGNLAIWMRKFYPDLVDIAVSSSAPLLAQVDFKEYNEIIGNILGTNCSSVITKAFDQIIQKLKSSSAVLEITKDFNLCSSLNVDNHDHIYHFFSSLMNEFNSIIQVASSDTVTRLCNAIMNDSELDDYKRIAKFVKKRREECADNYDDLVTVAKETNLDEGDLRPWLYQTCSSYGFFTTTSSENQPFKNTVPIELFYKLCNDVFDEIFSPERINKAIEATNKKFGGLNQNVSRVVSVLGKADPWYKLGLTENLNPDSAVILVEGASHCADLTSISPTDSDDIKNAKIKVQNYVKQWLQDGK